YFRGVPPPHRPPGLPTIGRAIHSRSVLYAVAHPRFARAHPNCPRVLRINRNRADRKRRLLVKNRLKRRTATPRLPDAATRRADIDRQPTTLANRGDIGNAAPHRSRT